MRVDSYRIPALLGIDSCDNMGGGNDIGANAAWKANRIAGAML